MEQMLNKSKVNMKRDLENSITNYNESVLTVHQVRVGVGGAMRGVRNQTRATAPW